VDHVRSQLTVSERRACSIVGQARSAQRRQRKVRADEAALTAAIVRLATRYGRYGYRRIRRLLLDEGLPRMPAGPCVKVFLHDAQRQSCTISSFFLRVPRRVRT